MRRIHQCPEAVSSAPRRISRLRIPASMWSSAVLCYPCLSLSEKGFIEGVAVFGGDYKSDKVLLHRLDVRVARLDEVVAAGRNRFRVMPVQVDPDSAG